MKIHSDKRETGRKSQTNEMLKLGALVFIDRNPGPVMNAAQFSADGIQMRPSKPNASAIQQEFLQEI